MPWSARAMRRLFNVYPPFLGAGVRVAHVAADWRSITVRMPLRWFNRNYVGTHFGGSLYAMTDPFFMIMAMRTLGPDYVVWDKGAEIEFISPGRGMVVAEFVLTDEDVAAMRQQTADGSKYLPWLTVDVKTQDGSPVARVRKQLYVRRKRAPGP